MKAITTKISIKLSLFLFALLFIANAAVSQAPPIYKFQNPTLTYGTAGQVNASYRFANVAPGLDAMVKITSMTGGITLLNIDRTLDGYSEAFQPEYQVPALSNGYIDFRIIFVQTGTTTPKAQATVDASGLDIDGSLFSGLTLKEYNQIDMGGGICTFNLLNSEISVSETGTSFNANNVTGNLFGELVDTAATQVMYSVRSYAVDTFYFRAGANNLLPGIVPRYASLYFKRFSYPTTGVLAINKLSGFSGVTQNEKVKLQWSLTEGTTANNIVLQKSATGKDFQPVSEFPAGKDANASKNYYYTDNMNTSGSVFYRLKIIAVDGKIQYSNVLRFNNENNDKTTFTVYPTIVQNAATVNVTVREKQDGVLVVTDMSGRIVKKTPVTVQQGNNSLVVSGFDQFRKGNYIVSIKTSSENLSKQIVVQ